MEERAEKALRDRIERERRVYGILPQVKEIRKIGEDIGNEFCFMVDFEGWSWGMCFIVKVYAKSYRIERM